MIILCRFSLENPVYRYITMGMGGYIWIINASSRSLKLTYQHSYQMNNWVFKSISPQSMEKFYIEYNETISANSPSDDAGEATFELDGANESFQLQARYPYNSGECGLKVDWSDLKSRDSYAVFPPPDQTSIGELGWFHNGSLSLLVMEKVIRNTVHRSSWKRFDCFCSKQFAVSSDIPVGVHYQKIFPLLLSCYQTDLLVCCQTVFSDIKNILVHSIVAMVTKICHAQ